ncbi:hypothetical protein J7K93_11305 [bacterium]|nr:hypothetical protein [bacterium]
MRQELKRKVIHISSVVFPISYLFIEKHELLFILGLLIVFAVSVELCRFFSFKCAKIFDKIVGPLLRFHEKQKFTGATNLLIAFYVSVLIFNQSVAISVMLFVALSDALSALAGKKWGKRKLFKDKTCIGCLVFIATGFLIILAVPNLPFAAGLTGMAAGTAADIFIDKIDDNITIPLISGIVMHIVLFL